MAANFKIRISKKNDSLHLNLSGELDGTSAHELLNVLRNHPQRVSRIFIHTDYLSHLHSFGREVFRNNMGAFRNYSAKLVFTGENASQFAIKGLNHIRKEDR